CPVHGTGDIVATGRNPGSLVPLGALPDSLLWLHLGNIHVEQLSVDRDLKRALLASPESFCASPNRTWLRHPGNGALKLGEVVAHERGTRLSRYEDWMLEDCLGKWDCARRALDHVLFESPQC